MPVKNLFGNRSYNNSSSISGAIATNTSTSVVAAAANPTRSFFNINNNDSNQGVWVKLQAASVDNIKKGIFVKAKDEWEMPPQSMYSGEISVIADTDSPDVYVTEY